MRGYGLFWGMVLSSLLVSCRAGTQGRTTLPSPLRAGFHEQTVSMPDGEKLRYTLYVPRGYDPGQPVPLIVALHYGGTVTPFYGRGFIEALVCPAFAELQAIVVAPDASGGDWTTERNERAVVWLTQNVLSSYAIDPRKVLLTGYSMGGRGTWYIGSRHQDLFTAAIPVAGDPAGSLEWTIPAYVLHSGDDELMPLSPTQRYVEQLQAGGAPVQLTVVSGLTHYQTMGYVEPLREAIPWLQQVWR